MTISKCFICNNRHSSCPDEKIEDKFCKDFRVGRCYTCKYTINIRLLHGTEESLNSWYKRGCEGNYPSDTYCNKRKKISRRKKKLLKRLNLWYY